ncbi:MAG: hypothetical protein ACRDVM_01210 [Acidimicrobiia bacterium]
MGLVDCAVLTVVESLGEERLALDRRHFTFMWPRHVESLTLLPDLPQ